MSNFNYLEYYTIEYPENSGDKYIFDPYLFGKGAWAELYSGNRKGKFVSKSLQKTLNEFYFKRSELPSLYNRFAVASPTEKNKLREITIVWLKEKIKALKQNLNTTNMPITRDTNAFKTGSMYFYVYDAKLKDKLPKWDSFPLTIVLEKRDHGFLGLNLHYLTVDQRSVLLGKMLQAHSSYNKNTDNLKLTLDYDILKDSPTLFKGYEKCIKEYLYSHIRSKILPIESHEWLFAVLLPLENFHYKK